MFDERFTSSCFLFLAEGVRGGGGGSKKFEDFRGGGVKIFGLGGVTDFGGVFFAGESVPHYMP